MQERLKSSGRPSAATNAGRGVEDLRQIRCLHSVCGGSRQGVCGRVWLIVGLESVYPSQWVCIVSSCFRQPLDSVSYFVGGITTSISNRNEERTELRMSGTAKHDVASASAAGSKKKKKSTSKPAAATNGSSVAIDSDTGMGDLYAFWGDTTSSTAKQGVSPSADVPSTAEQQQPPSADPSTNEPWMVLGGNKDDDEKIPQLPIPVCTPAQAANTLTRTELEHLFIDTTFYARLGFLEAPSCVKCAYRDAHARKDYRDAIAAKGCGRLVLWRKDTALPIHPDNMQTNSVVITCATAKALMRGEVVGGYRWDKNSQKMVCN